MDSGLLLKSFCAHSGVVKAKHYGEKFQPNIVERQVSYNVFIYPPRSVYDNKNVTLHLKLDKLYMIGKESHTNSAFMEGKIDFDQNTVYKNFSPPMEDFSMEYSKQLTITNDVAISTKINIMPGFRLSWWYTGDDIIPEPLVSNLRHSTDTYLRNIFVR